MVWCFAADGFNVDLSQAFRQTVAVIPISPVGNPFWTAIGLLLVYDFRQTLDWHTPAPLLIPYCC